MKLNMPSWLEKSERNEKLSPTTGHPRFPGILSIVFGVLHFCRKMAENPKMKKHAITVNMASIKGSQEMVFRYFIELIFLG